MQSTGRDPIDDAGARTLMASVDRVWVTRGKKLIEFDLGAGDRRAATEDALSAALGRSGTLRAPAFKIGRTLYVGYNEEILARVP